VGRIHEKWSTKRLSFDSYLVELGSWEDTVRKKLLTWLDESDNKRRKELAARLLSDLVNYFIGDDLSKSIKDLLELGRQLSRFEDFNIAVMGFEKKFYRDHLEHALRVMILSKSLVEGANMILDENKKRCLVLASIFHDLCYPLSISAGFFIHFSNIFSECFSSLKIQSPPVFHDHRLLIDFLSLLLQIEDDIFSFTKKYMYNHGVLGAIELLSYIKPDMRTKYIPAIRAVAFHDDEIDRPITFSETPVLALLVLCDAIQDWGRSHGGFTNHSISPTIKKFIVSPKLIHICLDYSKMTRDFLPLKQLYGKWKSLRRLHLNGGFPQLILSFDLPKYKKIDFLSLERLLKRIFSLKETMERLRKESHVLIRTPEGLRSLTDGDLKLCEFVPELIKYCPLPLAGKIGVLIGELEIIIDILKNKSYSAPTFKKFDIFIDPLRGELIAVPQKGGDPRRLEFISQKDGSLIVRMEQERTQSVGVLIRCPEEIYFDIHTVIVGFACVLVLYAPSLSFSAHPILELENIPKSVIEGFLKNIGRLLELSAKEKEVIREIGSIWYPITNYHCYLFSEQ